MKIPSYGDRFTTFGRRRSLFPASRVFSRSGLFLRRLKISSAVHDEIILEETQKAAYEEQCLYDFIHQEQPNEDYFEGINDYIDETMSI